MIKMVPQVLDDINIKAIWWPRKEIDIIFLESGLNNLGCVFWIIIFLEIKSAWVHVKITVASEDIVLEYLAIQFLVEVSFDPYDASNTMGSCHSPHCNFTTTMLHPLLGKLRVQTFPRPPPAPLYPIRAK
jgi:hypothetical protein